MSLPNERGTVREFAEKSIRRLRVKIFLIGGFVVIPLLIGVGIYYEYSSISKVLIPVTSQVAQAISLGDEIGIQKITDSLSLIPQISLVRVYLGDGTCASESKNRVTRESWSSSIQEPCQSKVSPFEILIRRDISKGVADVAGNIDVYLKTPWSYILFLPLSFVLLIFVANLFIKLTTEKLMASFVAAIDSISTAFEETNVPDFEFEEIDVVYQKLLKLKNLELEMATDEILKKAATQVSHDIRSPLAALEMVLPDLEQLPEQKRLIARNAVNRIRDIANELLGKYKRISTTPSASEEKGESELLMSLIDSIVSEKRIEYQRLPGVEISFVQCASSYGLFSVLNSVAFKRVLSNLVNNAIEALPNQVGRVEIKLLCVDGQYNEVSVIDNGVGMSRKLIERLGGERISIGKPQGSGLGLFSAYEFMTAVGGKIEVLSNEGRGTNIKLQFKCAESPSWFVPSIALGPGSNVIVLDDDESIHHVWDEKLRFALEEVRGMDLKCFSLAGSFMSFYRENFFDIENPIFLFDYELIGSPDSGLDLIEMLGVQKQSILVTSRFDESGVRQHCERLGVRLIPKSMINLVPIEV